MIGFYTERARNPWSFCRPSEDAEAVQIIVRVWRGIRRLNNQRPVPPGAEQANKTIQKAPYENRHETLPRRRDHCGLWNQRRSCGRSTTAKPAQRAAAAAGCAAQPEINDHRRLCRSSRRQPARRNAERPLGNELRAALEWPRPDLGRLRPGQVTPAPLAPRESPSRPFAGAGSFRFAAWAKAARE